MKKVGFLRIEILLERPTKKPIIYGPAYRIIDIENQPENGNYKANY